MRKSNYILLFILVLFAASCKKYLDQVPDDRLTVSDIFNTKTNTDAFLANIYHAIPDELAQRYNGTNNSGPWTSGADEAKYNWDFNYGNKLNASTWSPTDGDVDTYWSHFYQAIRNCTYFMQHIDGATNEVTPALKKNYKAEARAMRAYFYFNLLRIYGPVILFKDETVLAPDAPISAEQLPRAPFDSCVSFITSELQAAADSLSTKPYNSEFGRFTRGAALAYKEQVLMLAASPLYNGNTDYAALKNTDGAQLISQTYDAAKWQKAADAAKAFFSEFVPTTYDLFTESDDDPFQAAYLSCRDVMTTDWNKEWIFARSNSDNWTQYDRTPNHQGAPSDAKGGGALGVTQTQVDAYFTANGRSIDDAQSGYVSSGFSDFQAPYDVDSRSTFNPWTNREPRFYVGVTYSGSYWLNQAGSSTPIITNMEYSGNAGRRNSTTDVTPTGYIVRKNVGPNGNGRGALLLRLGNLYLDYAEALNEADPGNPDVMKYLNLIRKRAGVPLYGSAALAEPQGQSAVRDAIRKERRVELAFENVRFFDTRRWKIAPQTDNSPFYGMNIFADGNDFYKVTQLETRKFQRRDYLFPIPQNELQIDRQLMQNPGW